MQNIILKKPGNNPYEGQTPKAINVDKPLYYGVLGTGVYSNLDIKGGEWTDQFGRVQACPDLIFDTVLFTVEMSKNIVKTPIQGRNGTVKEYIADGDYYIRIEGLVTGFNNSRPDADITNLKKMLDAPIPLQINSKYLTQLGVYSIIVERYNLPQLPGQYSQQPFSIDAISDAPVILLIK